MFLFCSFSKMVQGRPPPGLFMSWFIDLGGMVEARRSGAIFAWRCHGGCSMTPVDLNEYLARCGPRYSLHNEISVCVTCGSPTTVMKSPRKGTPLTPMKDEDLWLLREVRLGDPEEWFEIDWMDGGARFEAVLSRRGRR